MMAQNTKKRVLVTYVEAGFGHITTANSIATAIETLHDPNIEVIRKYTFKDNPVLRKIEQRFVKDVKWANTFPLYNYIQMWATHIGGIHNSLPLVVSTVYRCARKRYVKILQEIKPDIIIDPHFLTSIEYAAMHLFSSDLNCGRFFPHSHQIARGINECVSDPSILDIYKEFEQAIRAKRNGAIPIAKFIQTYL